MTKAREIAELGQKLTVDGSGNLEFAGDVSLPNGSSTSNRITLGNSDDTKFFHNGVDGYWMNDTGQLIIRNLADDKDVKIESDNGSGGTTEYFRADGSIGQAQMFYYGDKKLATVSTGIDVTGNVAADKLKTTDGVDIDMDSTASGQLELDGNGYNFGIALNLEGANIYTNSASRDLIFGTNETERMRINGSGVVDITSSTTDVVKITTESTTVGPNLLFRNTDGTLARLASAETNALRIETGTTNKEMVRFVEANGTVFNETGVDLDFRVESDSGTHMLFVDAGNNRVGINTSSPSVGFEVSQNEMKQVGGTTTFTMDATNDGSGAHVGVFEVNTNPARGSRIALTDNDGREFGMRRQYNSGSDIGAMELYVHDGSSSRPTFTFHSSAGFLGTTVHNEAGNDQDFRVESDGQTHMLFVDAGNNSVNIQSSANTGYPLNIASGIQMGVLNDVPDSNAYSFIGATDGGAGGIRSGEGSHILIAARSTAPRDIIMTTRDGGGISRERLTIKGNDEEMVLNDDSRDYNVRMESNDRSHMFFMDAGTNKVQIGSNAITTGQVLTVTDTASRTYNSGNTIGDLLIARYNNDQTTQVAGLAFRVTTNNAGNNSESSISHQQSNYASHAGYMHFNMRKGNGSRYRYLTLYSEEGAIFNDDSYSFMDFRVESDNYTNALFVDSSADYVKMDGNGIYTNGAFQFNKAGSVPANTNRRVRVTLSNYGAAFVKLIALRTNGGNSTVYWDGKINNNNNTGYATAFNSDTSSGTISYTFTNNGDGTFDWDFNNSGSSGNWSIYISTHAGDSVGIAETTYT